MMIPTYWHSLEKRSSPPRGPSVTAYRTWTGTSRNLCVGSMATLILPLISNKNGAVYDSTVGVISRLLQTDVAKAGDPQRASEILVRVVKREQLPRLHRITRSLKNAALRTFTQALLVSKPSRVNPSTVITTRSSTRLVGSDRDCSPG